MAKSPKSMRLASTLLTRQIKSSRLLATENAQSQQKYETLPQLRATEALEFGIGVQHPGYNLYVAGENGIGRLEYVLDYLEPIATRANSPSDWLYVNNFDDPREPHSIRLPPGEGTKFRDDLDEFIEALLATFPAIFEHPSFLQKKTAISRKFEEIYDNAVGNIEEQAAKQSIAVYREDGTITFSPIIDGEIADESEFAQLKGEEREKFHQNVNNFEDQLNDALLELPKWQRAQKDQIRQLFDQTITQSLKPLFDELQQAYQGHAGMLLYLAQMNRDIPKVIKELLAGDEKESNAAETLPSRRKILENRYLPNLFVRSGGRSGAPIIVEPNPTYANLFGQINHLPDHGSFNSDFQQIVPGSLHRANGGYLIADMEKVLQNQQTWDALKRMLRQSSITIEQSTLDNVLGLPSSIKPESIPINVKIILLGPRQVYYAMSEMDPDFDELFQVLVDFDNELNASEENLKQFTQLMHHKCQQLNFNPLSSRAVGRLAEYACRLAEHQQKISANIDLIMEVVTEANFWCIKGQSKQITNSHITKALETKKRRNAR
ncbi:MAG: AAA family ATPase, partial [Kangiellaceae bacterium]|nr:AAA family ATPase [Kangiellaceae bacterium]